MRSLREEKKVFILHSGSMKFFISILAALFLSQANVSANDPRLSPMILEGTKAAPAQFPYMVSVYYNGQHVCGGAIIHQNFILTAARCVHDQLANYVIKAGTINHKSVDANAQAVNTSVISVHKEFSGGCKSYQKHDIALVKVSPAFLFNEYVQPIRLPQQDSGLRKGRKAIMSGWGLGEAKGPVDELKYAEVLMIADPYCREALKLSRNGSLYENQFCVDYPINHYLTCEGDSGDPLVGYEIADVETNYTVLLGIASEVSQACKISEEKPVFTQISRYADWIKAEMGTNGAAELKFNYFIILMAAISVASKFLSQ